MIIEKITMKISVSRKLGLVIAANTASVPTVIPIERDHRLIRDHHHAPHSTSAYRNRSNGLAGSGQMDAGECPLWVKSRHQRMFW
jgi:hypothetical protein